MRRNTTAWMAVAAGLAILLAAGPLSAQKVVDLKTSDGKGADAYVETRTQAANHGNEERLAVAAQPAGSRKIYLRFDLTSMTEPIKGATLYLTVIPNTGKEAAAFNVFGLNDGTEDDWVEGNGGEDNTPENEIAYKNAPANDPKRMGGKYDPEKKTGGGLDNSKTAFLGTVVVHNDGYKLNNKAGGVSFGSEAMVDWLQKDTNKLVTLIITRQETSQTHMVNFASKEQGKAQPPLLKVSSEALPIPVQPEVPPKEPATKPAEGA